MQKRARSGCVIFFILILFVSLRAFGQGGATGAISSVVQDKSGGAVAGAKVTAMNESSKEVVRTDVTDTSGLFTMTLLPVGTYRIEISAPNFADTKAPGVVVRVRETTRLTIPLDVELFQQQVEVSAEVLSIKTADATTGESLSGPRLRRSRWRRRTSSNCWRSLLAPRPLLTRLRSLAAAP
jgi:hypothetical protein